MTVLAQQHETDAASRVSGHIVHVLPSFGVGGVPVRLVDVINHVGGPFHHTIVALDDNFDAAARLTGDASVTLLPRARRSRGMVRATFGAARVLRRLRPDLLMTSNWGAIEWALANRLLPVARHIHLEDGFGVEEADGQIRRRVLCRRLALSGSARLIVPSRRLEELALRVWKLSPEKVAYLPNGIDVERFAAPPPATVSAFTRREGELIVGTVAPLRPEKNIGRLLRAFAAASERVSARLVIAGDGSEKGALEQQARQLGIADRVVFTGRVMPEAVLGMFDVFTMSSDTEQMPIALLEAMAAGRAIAAVDVGDIKWMVCEENRDFIAPRDDNRAFAAAIEGLLADRAVRDSLGRKNRDRVAAEFPRERMFAAYSAMFFNDPKPAGRLAPVAAA